MFDANYETPDYDTDSYFVPKHRKYCLANFLTHVMNKKESLSQRKLFFDYAPNNALKKELGTHFTLSNKNIYETYVSKTTLEKRKVEHTLTSRTFLLIQRSKSCTPSQVYTITWSLVSTTNADFRW